MYLTASRPNIAFAVGMCARYQVNPLASPLHCAKCVLKYVLGIVDYGLWYSFDTAMLARLCVLKIGKVHQVTISF